MEEYINYFLDMVNWRPKINVHLYDNEIEMHKARIEMTKDELIRKYLESENNTTSSGTYIIPPQNDEEYDILLVKSGILIYQLWHEMVHIFNYHNAIESGYYYLNLITNPTHFNWDEFQARKISTIMYFKYLEDVSGERFNSQERFDVLAKMLQKEIKDSELVDENIVKYNLMQYLGFVSGVEEICKGFFKLPEFIESTPMILKQYKDLNYS